MDLLYMILIAISVCIDNFALSMAYSLQAEAKKKQMLAKVLLIFPLIQMSLALIGWFAGNGLARFIDIFDHWVAFGLLAYVGIKFIIESIKEMKESNEENSEQENSKRNISLIALLGVAIVTSTDSLAVGLTYALLDVNIISAILFIGVVTAILSIFGFSIGDKIGRKFENQVEFIAGVVLFIIGLKILIEHLIE